jgi:hypothetical protein
MPHAINVSKVGGLDCGDHSWRFPVWVGEIDAEELLVAQGLSGRRGRCYEGIVGGSQRGRLSIHRKPEGILRKQYEELAATEVPMKTRIMSGSLPISRYRLLTTEFRSKLLIWRDF